MRHKRLYYFWSFVPSLGVSFTEVDIYIELPTVKIINETASTIGGRKGVRGSRLFPIQCKNLK